MSIDCSTNPNSVKWAVGSGKKTSLFHEAGQQRILSTQCQILYCSTAVKELIGWRDEDLIDTGFLDLVNGA